MQAYQSKKGVASIIGGVFIILIIVSGYTFYALSNRTTNEMQSTLRSMSALDVDKSQEKLSFSNIQTYSSGSVSGLEITAVNAGSQVITVRYIGILDENNRYAQYEILKPEERGMKTTISSGNYEKYQIPINGFSTSGKYLVKMITEKGNIFTAGYPISTETANPTSITFDKPSGFVGAPILVYGSGFSSSATVALLFDSTPLVNSMTDVRGSFTAIFNIPTTTIGGHAVKATDANLRSASETLIVKSLVYLIPDYGSEGKTIIVSGSNALTPNSDFSAKWDTTTLPLSGTTHTDLTGTIPPGVTFAVPSGASSGVHEVTIKDSHDQSVLVFFKVTGITLNPNGGEVASAVAITGSGFAPNSALTAQINSEALLLTGTAISDASGNIQNLGFVVPPRTAGMYIITIIDANGNAARAPFTIVPKISINPTAGPLGITVTLTGINFAPNSVIHATWNGEPLTLNPPTPTTDSAGSIPSGVTFQVPNYSSGSYQVVVMDASLNSAKAMFGVSPIINLDKTSGPRGAQVYVTGSNFAASSLLGATWDGSPLPINGPTTTTTSGEIQSGVWFSAPSSIQGDHIVTIIDGRGDSASATYAIQNPSVALDPVRGGKDSVITVSGPGYAASAPLTATLGLLSVTLSKSTTDPSGNIQPGTTFTVPSMNPGVYSFDISDSSGNQANTLFSVGGIILNPDTGSALARLLGDEGLVHVSGYGFDPNSGLTAKWDGSNLTLHGTTTTDSLGRIPSDVTFNWPLSWMGSHTVTITDANGNSYSATFSVVT